MPPTITHTSKTKKTRSEDRDDAVRRGARGTGVRRAGKASSGSTTEVKARKHIDIDKQTLAELADEVAKDQCDVVLRDKKGNVFLISLLARPVRMANGRPVYRFEDAEKIGMPPP